MEKSTVNIKKSSLPAFYREIGGDLQKTEERLLEMAVSDNEELQEAALKLINSGGKRLRPALVLLAGKCGSVEKNKDKLIDAAAAIELIHTASLIHDDIVDETPLRRGQPTLNHLYGAETAVYCGDLLLLKAVIAIAACGDKEVYKAVNDTANEMCRGEFLQSRTAKTADIGNEEYLTVIRRKTANLMACACKIGALIAGAGPKTVAALSRFGENLGLAFQITDDILDYIADDSVFGKRVGSDLREGLATMPLICAYERSGEKEMLRRLFRLSRTSEKAAAELLAIVNRDEGCQRATEIALSYVKEAKAALADIENEEVRRCFFEIADAVSERRR